MKSQARNSSVELLRILAMCAVIVLHYNNADIGGAMNHATGLNAWALVFLESLSICAVDLFVLISGYFLCTSSKRRLIKPLALIVQVCIFGALGYILQFIQGGSFSFKSLVRAMIPNNYFVALYAALYLISPYLNLLFQRLSKQRFRILVVLMLILFAVWPTLLDFVADTYGTAFTGMSTINAFDSQRGYTIVNFVLMYTLGAYIRQNEEEFKKLPAALLLAASVIILTVWGYYFQGSAWSYCNPLVILCACAVLLLFLRWNISSKLINHLAKGAFTCFLVHSLFFSFLDIEQAAKASLPLMLVHILISAAVIYLCCYIVYVLWDLLMRHFFQTAGKLLRKLDCYISLEDAHTQPQ